MQSDKRSRTGECCISATTERVAVAVWERPWPEYVKLAWGHAHHETTIYKSIFMMAEDHRAIILHVQLTGTLAALEKCTTWKMRRPAPFSHHLPLLDFEYYADFLPLLPETWLPFQTSMPQHPTSITKSSPTQMETASSSPIPALNIMKHTTSQSPVSHPP